MALRAGNTVGAGGRRRRRSRRRIQAEVTNMNIVLLVITLISAVTAIVALISARRVRRIEHERSEARVAALARAADTHGTLDGGWTSVAGEWQWTPEPTTQAERGSDLGFGIGAATGVTRASRDARPARI